MGLKPRPEPTKGRSDKSSPLRGLAASMKAHALSLPGAYEDFPWGESVAKVNGKVFVFLGRKSDLDQRLGFAVKLPVSGEGVLSMPFAEPTGYGLGRSGWVSITCSREDALPLGMLIEWVEESYRAVAPKKLVAQLRSS